jgi:hypothetical protein
VQSRVLAHPTIASRRQPGMAQARRAGDRSNRVDRGSPAAVTQDTLRPDTLGLVLNDPALAEQYRQATVNYQVADLLDVRARGAETPEQAATLRRRAADRRHLGDRLVQDLLDRLAARRPTSSTGALQPLS